MITAPTNCPSCDYPLEWSNDNLYCRNSDCGATAAKRVEHFAKTLKIKGLGPAAIQKLELSSIYEIYDMDIAYITMMLGSGKLAVKLFEEIENSKRQPLNTVLPALGIPLIGKTATEKLSKVCETLYDIDEQTCQQAGLGPKATSNLLDWLENHFEELLKLPFTFAFEQGNISNQSKGIICITGKLNSFKTKADAKLALEKLGYVVKDSITKDVNILVNESGRETDKTKKAANSGVRIVNNLNELIGEN